ncbi:magnesium chelatase domain-containing protein [Rossellomorea vietnamensis]|uniref:magnesium chelatase domain-containing protein n=1 Tax=Rossellomorea vietnamensis TaxID=218284 RepID=UPI003CF02E37
MTSKVTSVGLKGLEGYRVGVEVRISQDTESMVIVGLPDASVKESRERVLASLAHFDSDVTDRKVVVNLSPSDQKKNGALFDLAIAVAALKELGEVKCEIPADTAFVGGLSLDGSVVSGEGILPAIIAAKGLGIRIRVIYLPDDPALPFHMLQEVECVVVRHIEEVVGHLEGQESLLLSPRSISERAFIAEGHRDRFLVPPNISNFNYNAEFTEDGRLSTGALKH